MHLDSAQTLKQLASLLKADYSGDPNFLITGINEIHVVQKGDITFVDHPKYYNKALNSKATTIIINKVVDRPEGKALIFSDDPFRDFVFLIKRFKPFQPAPGMISDTAIIGERTTIQPGVFIGNHVIIGDNCLIHPNVTIYDHSVIGDHVIIHSGTVIGSDAFYFKRRPEMHDKLASGGRVVIDNHVEIGSCCTIDRGVTGDTTIGNGSKLDNQIHIGHDTIIGRNCLIAAQVGVSGCVIIEDNVVIWGQVGIQKDLTIGENAIVMGQSGVTKSLAPGITYWGLPAKPARETMKEMAFIKKLPELFKKF